LTDFRGTGFVGCRLVKQEGVDMSFTAENVAASAPEHMGGVVGFAVRVTKCRTDGDGL
jgi:hypothetical protein